MAQPQAGDDLIYAKMERFENRPIKTKSGTPPSLAEARETVLKAAATIRERPWNVTVAGSAKLLGRLDIRKHTIVVEISLAASEYSIAYRNSSRMHYDAQQGTIHHYYNQWVKELAENIDRGFASR